MVKTSQILSQLRSWENGYISPVAQIAIKEGCVLIEDLLADREECLDKIKDLKDRVEDLERVLKPFIDPKIMIKSEDIDEAREIYDRSLIASSDC